MSRMLPVPTSTETVYLAAVLAELKALRAELARFQPPADVPSDTIELREPELQPKLHVL